MPILSTPFAALDLQRQPPRPDDPLQAFDAADEYLLGELHERGLENGARVLVLNDSFGALAASLATHAQVTSSGDSHLAHLALQDNLARNGLAADTVRFVPASEVATWSRSGDGIGLADVVANAEPTMLIGTSTQPAAFTEQIVRQMASKVERPIIMPLSNPTSKCEALPQDLERRSGGRLHLDP